MMDASRKRPSPTKLLLYALATGIGLVFLIPFVWILLTSLKTNADIFKIPLTILPAEVTLEQYRAIFTEAPELLTYFFNSAIVTLTSVFVIVLLGAMAGYAYARYQFMGKNISFWFLLLVLFVPWIVFLVPIYLLESILNLINTRMGLILPYIALNLPLAIFIMRGHFALIPRDVEEAAALDGCNVFQMWSLVMLPMVKSGLATVAILSSIVVWEEFMFAKSIVTSQSVWTIPIGITMLQQEGQSWAFGILSAAIIISVIPLLALFIFFQQYFIRGIAEGAVKG